MKSIVLKPWGSYEVILKDSNFVIKKIIVKPGGVLSLQSHENRSEHWVVVKGVAEITINETKNQIQENENIFIPKKTKHRLANKQSEDLIVIEVWYGEILEEEDIIRYEDIYNRQSQ